MRSGRRARGTDTGTSGNGGTGLGTHIGTGPGTGHRHWAGGEHRGLLLGPPGPAPYGRGGTGSGPARVVGHRLRPRVSQGPGPHTGFPVLPHASTLTPAPPRRRTPLGLCLGTAPPWLRTLSPLESPQTPPGPGARSPGANPAPFFRPGTGLWPPGSHSASMCQIPLSA